MAVVGDAYVVVHAITAGVKRDIEQGFKGVDRVGQQMGNKLGQNVTSGLTKALSGGAGLSAFQRQSVAAADAFSSLTRAGYVLAPAITAVLGAVGALGNGLISLVGVLGAAVINNAFS